MIESSIAKRYAKALFEIALESSKQGDYFKHLSALNELFAQNPEFLDTLSNRFIDLNARLRVIDDLAAKLNFDLEFKNFLKVLIKKGRLEIFEGIVSSFKNTVYTHEGKLEAFITSAKALGDNQYEELKKLLGDVTGKNIIVQKEIKPEVLGGVAIRIAGEIFDGTIRSQLNRMTESLRRERQ